jgi:hypothetical protein
VYAIWDYAGQPVELTFRAIIEAHQLTYAKTIERLAGQVNDLPVSYPKGLGNFYGYSARRGASDGPSATQVLITRFGVINAKPGSTVRCPAHDDVHRSLTIFADDQRVLCGSPSCVLNGQGSGVGSIRLERMA